MSLSKKNPWRQVRDEREAVVEKAWKKLRNKYGIKAGYDRISIQPGWIQLVDQTLGEMIAAGWDRELHQLKQKFCALVIYIGAANRDVIEAIRRGIALSVQSCEYCGEPHELTIPRSGSALCLQCYNKEMDIIGRSEVFWRVRFYSPNSLDEKHGCFEAVEDDSDNIHVWDVGERLLVRHANKDGRLTNRYETRREAAEAASQAAKTWKPKVTELPDDYLKQIYGDV